jgi:hypothetical protein
LADERVERGGWQHFGRVHGEVERHHWGAVPFVEDERGDLVVGV